jgi:hypothetical protein
MISTMLEAFWGGCGPCFERLVWNEMSFVQLMAEFWGSPVYRNYGTLIRIGRYAPPSATLALGLKGNRATVKGSK